MCLCSHNLSLCRHRKWTQGECGVPQPSSQWCVHGVCMFVFTQPSFAGTGSAPEGNVVVPNPPVNGVCMCVCVCVYVHTAFPLQAPEVDLRGMLNFQTRWMYRKWKCVVRKAATMKMILIHQFQVPSNCIVIIPLHIHI